MIVFKSLNVSEKIPVYLWSVTVDKQLILALPPLKLEDQHPSLSVAYLATRYPAPRKKILYEALIIITIII